jgi:hypothetical protein
MVEEARYTRGGAAVVIALADGRRLVADRVWYGTGSVIDIAQERWLQPVLRAAGTPLVSGLPDLTRQLRVHGACCCVSCSGKSVAHCSVLDKWNFFVLGAYAALQLGPDAGNLAGARTGSARVGDILRAELAAAPPGAAHAQEDSEAADSAEAADQEASAPQQTALADGGVTVPAARGDDAVSVDAEVVAVRAATARPPVRCRNRRHGSKHACC